MINAETMLQIRTYPIRYASKVYFVFAGTLFVDNTKEIIKLATFKGFNCATRLPDNEVTSYEYVVFDNPEIEPIWNPKVDFCFPANTSYPSTTAPNSDNFLTTTSLPIPVNRQGYRALEHFCFVYDLGYLFEVAMSWTRYSEPRLTSQKDKGYRWIYTADGYKTYTLENFPNFNFKSEEPNYVSLD